MSNSHVPGVVDDDKAAGRNTHLALVGDTLWVVLVFSKANYRGLGTSIHPLLQPWGVSAATAQRDPSELLSPAMTHKGTEWLDSSSKDRAFEVGS